MALASVNVFLAAALFPVCCFKLYCSKGLFSLTAQWVFFFRGLVVVLWRFVCNDFVICLECASTERRYIYIQKIQGSRCRHLQLKEWRQIHSHGIFG